MMDPALDEIRELARQELKDVISKLAELAKEGNHHCARLLFECAGFVRPTTGRPRNDLKKLPGPPALSEEEYEKKASELDDILESHGS